MHPNEKLIQDFYTAFGKRDYGSMQQCYHDDATFSDPVFPDLDADQVKAMWQMLLSASKDIRVTCSEVKANDLGGTCRWDAWYTFSRTGKKVHNIIHASFRFRDGKIIEHIDRFDLWRWSRQALGFSGWILGWSSIVRNKVRGNASNSLQKFMREKK